jgi:hypothetical protein
MSTEIRLYEGLQAIADDAFPRTCGACGRTISSAREFLAATEAIRGKSGLKQGRDDDDRPVVELYRNCPCGSTLMEFFADRRDNSPAGQRVRARFGELLERLVAAGVPRDTARQEVLRLLRGQRSETLANEYGLDVQTR